MQNSDDDALQTGDRVYIIRRGARIFVIRSEMIEVGELQDPFVFQQALDALPANADLGTAEVVDTQSRTGEAAVARKGFKATVS